MMIETSTGLETVVLHGQLLFGNVLAGNAVLNIWGESTEIYCESKYSWQTPLIQSPLDQQNFRVPPHPYMVHHEALWKKLRGFISNEQSTNLGPLWVGQSRIVTMELLTRNHSPEPSQKLLEYTDAIFRQETHSKSRQPRVRKSSTETWSVEVVSIPIWSAVWLLESIGMAMAKRNETMTEAPALFGAELLFLATVARHALALVRDGNIDPIAVPVTGDFMTHHQLWTTIRSYAQAKVKLNQPDLYWERSCRHYVSWIPGWRERNDIVARRRLADACPQTLVQALGKMGPDAREVTIDSLFSLFVNAIVREMVPPIGDECTSSADSIHRVKPVTGWDYKTREKRREYFYGQYEKKWTQALTAPLHVNNKVNIAASIVSMEPDLSQFYMQKVMEYSGWNSQTLGNRTGDDRYRLCLQLHFPELITNTETGDMIRGPWKLSYHIQDRQYVDVTYPIAAVWQAAGQDVRIGPDLLKSCEEWLVPALRAAGDVIPAISESLSQLTPEECALEDHDLAVLLSERDALETLDMAIVLPEFQTAESGELLVRIFTRAPGEKRVPRRGRTKGQSSGLLDLDAVLSFDWEIACGDIRIPRQEFEQLVVSKLPLIQVNGQWTLVPLNDIERALSSLDLEGEEASIAELARWQAGSEEEGVGTQVLADGQTGELLDTVAGRLRPTAVDAPASLDAKLRDYQLAGLSWLMHCRNVGLGACLADDMGLGKTIQVIAFLLKLQEQGEEGPHLVVCPTSVLQNWRHEFRRFASRLRIHAHHGSGRVIGHEALLDIVQKSDVVLTTYALLSRDFDTLGAIAWNEVVLDEAQNIKNAATQQAQAARRLSSVHRVALTGTPIENRLDELWSIVDFTNSRYLGGETWFKEHFGTPIERKQDERAAARLARFVAPILLRRKKTDPGIADELPQKQEMKEFCSLTREQVTLYQAIVDDMLTKLREAVGIARRGVILSGLVRLKQVCNHPARFTGEEPWIDRSGKLLRLVEMMDEIVAAGEHALIFTQFRQMGLLLAKTLGERYGQPVDFLHGGVAELERVRMVERFQKDESTPPAFVLSLKAGGVGLNLTRATRVFHFDRWWNPAVENQATDRAYRIGQQRQVTVYKFICNGTLEEKIDVLIDRKRALADTIVSGEGWITELSDEELRDLFTLGEDALADE